MTLFKLQSVLWVWSLIISTQFAGKSILIPLTITIIDCFDISYTRKWPPSFWWKLTLSRIKAWWTYFFNRIEKKRGLLPPIYCIIPYQAGLANLYLKFRYFPGAGQMQLFQNAAPDHRKFYAGPVPWPRQVNIEDLADFAGAGSHNNDPVT